MDNLNTANIVKTISKELCMTFKINRIGELFYGETENMVDNTEKKKIASCVFSDDEITFNIEYDYYKADRPLCVKAKAKVGDKIKINILSYRIELYVNSVLLDEEWPCGSHFITDNIISNDCEVDVKEIADKKENKELNKKDKVLKSFKNAEDWKPDENVNVGDCMPYTHMDRYHVLYLKDRHHHTSKWGLGAHQWEHISTKDFKIWDIHPMAVEIDDPNEGSICTGSWICYNDKHYLFYTVRTCNNAPAKICRSISYDGYNFKKDKDFYFTLSDKYIEENARDPKVFKDKDDVYHMLLTSSLKQEKVGCLVHLMSEDLEDWQETEEPAYIAPKDMGEPECPDYFYKDGFYYLVCSLKGKAYYQYSKDPFKNWCIPKEPIIPCQTVPKAAIWNDRLIFTGFNGENGYGGTMTFLEAIVLDSGELKYI